MVTMIRIKYTDGCLSTEGAEGSEVMDNTDIQDMVRKGVPKAFLARSSSKPSLLHILRNLIDGQVVYGVVYTPASVDTDPETYKKEVYQALMENEAIHLLFTTLTGRPFDEVTDEDEDAETDDDEPHKKNKKHIPTTMHPYDAGMEELRLKNYRN